MIPWMLPSTAMLNHLIFKSVVEEDMGVSKNMGFPQIIHLNIGFGTIIFTIHFGWFSP